MGAFNKKSYVSNSLVTYKKYTYMQISASHKHAAIEYYKNAKLHTIGAHLDLNGPVRAN